MIGCVKTFSTASILFLLGLGMFPLACKPQAPDVERLSSLQNTNSQLREEIGQMQALIRQAGEDTPQLQEQITQRNQEVESALRQRTALRQRETDLKLRYIELDGRLKAFRNTFEEMKNNVANQTYSFP